MGAGETKTALDVMLSGVDADRMMAGLRKIAPIVKLSGTPEELESLAILRAELDGFGYRTEVLLHEAYISLPGASKVVHDGREIRSITHSMAKSVEGLEGELVFVGKGMREDFAKADVAGRIALIDGIAYEDSTLFANEAGAIAQVQICPDELLHEMCISPVWGSPDAESRALLPRTAVVSIPQSEGVRLRALCEAGNAPRVRIDAEVRTGWCKTPILIAEMGCENGAPFVLLNGHHDTWHYGVMDNGTANVTMLEVARLLADHRADWKRGVRLAVWSGHSHGRYSGSAWYADAFWSDLEARCVAEINVDSTGGEGADTLVRSGVSAQLAGLVAEAVKRETGETHLGLRQGRVADQSFWGIGIVSAFGSVSHHSRVDEQMPFRLGRVWHTPEDLIEHISPANLARDTRLVLHVMARLVCDPVPPIDNVRWCGDLVAELAPLRDALEPELSLAPLDEAIRRLCEELAGPHDGAALVATSRHLIPLDHTTGDRFRRDLAMPREPWPALEPLRRLAKAAPEDAPFLRVGATETLNRFIYEIDRAASELGEPRGRKAR